ncbi:MAG: GNAT family protein, partial [Clostridia bacterium]
NFGFTRLRLNRIECDCFIENRSSARVMERVGMSFEGESRDYYLVNNVQRSVARYAILKRDWEVMKRDAKTKT